MTTTTTNPDSKRNGASLRIPIRWKLNVVGAVIILTFSIIL